MTSRAFIDALLREDLSAAGSMINNETSVNAPIGESLWTPLHYAAEHQLAQVAKWLLENGANPNAKDFAGQTPAFLAIDSAADVASDAYVKTGVRSYDVSTIRVLLVGGADPNMRSDNGTTLLELAIRRGNSEADDLLRSFGAKSDSD